MDDEINEEENGAFNKSTGLHFTLDVGLTNYKLTDKQRNALRKAISECMATMQIKVDIMGITPLVQVTAQETSSTYGRRNLYLPKPEELE